MVNLNDILVPEGQHQTCQHEGKERVSGYYGYDRTVTCSDPALVKLPTDTPNLYCYAHAIEHLRADLAASRGRLAYWEQHGSKGGPGSWGTSIAMTNSLSDIGTIFEIIRLLEAHASQQMGRR